MIDVLCCSSLPRALTSRDQNSLTIAKLSATAISRSYTRFYRNGPVLHCHWSCRTCQPCHSAHTANQRIREQRSWSLQIHQRLPSRACSATECARLTEIFTRNPTSPRVVHGDFCVGRDQSILPSKAGNFASEIRVSRARGRSRESTA